MTVLRRLLFLIMVSAGILMPCRSECIETIVLNIVLNEETKGEFFVKIADSGDFLARREDLRAMGLRDPAGKTETIDGEEYVELKTIEGVTTSFEEKTLTLEILASPALLPKKTIDFMPQQHVKVHYPADPGGFLNYGLGFEGGDQSASRRFDLNNEAGVRLGDFLLLSGSSYRKTEAEEKFVRLSSSVTYDRRRQLDRFVLGDFFASSGDLGGNLNLGGLSYSKIYRIDPYFIRYPMASFSGLVSLPSEAEIYIDGTRIRTEKLAPGGFELKNISYYGGSSAVSVVIKDPFGREHRLSYPFYFTDILLRKGLHEYSYNAGLRRKDFGEESDRYGAPAFSAFHNFGVSESLTAGFRAEGTGDALNLGPQASYLIREAGVATLSLSGSVRNGGAGGFGGLFTHGYQGGKISTRVLYKGFSREYATAGDEVQRDRIAHQFGAGVGYGGTREFGSLSLDMDRILRYEGQDRRTAAVTYSRTLGKKTLLTLTFRNIMDQSSSNELFAGLTYRPFADITLSAGYGREGDSDTKTVSVQKNPPVGEGPGYRASLERADSPANGATVFNPFIQYNMRHGIYSGEYRGEFKDGGEKIETYRLSASGGVAYAGGSLGFTRPIADSFGLVQVGELEGVRVYQSNQEVGRTDEKGKIFLPDLGSYYNNRISIDDRDIPINYSISEIVKHVSPPLRSGSVIPFEAKRFQAITGLLKIRIEGEVKPVEYNEVTLNVEGKEITFPTGKGGEYYLENIRPGSHAASFVHKGNGCVFEMRIPESEELIVDLGVMTCDGVR